MAKRGTYLYYKGETPLFISDQVIEAEEGISYLSLDNSVDFSKISQYLVRDGVLYRRSEMPMSNLRVVLVSDYGVNCGIATYSKYLRDELAPIVKELRVLAEIDPKGTSHEELDQRDNVVRCWLRNEHYSRIVEECEKFSPDLVIIQHEYGLFHKVGMWNTLLSQLSKWRTVVTLHTVLEHRVEDKQVELDYTSRIIAEAACPEVIVHTPRARECLRSRGYSGRIHFIPHGCPAPQKENRLPVTQYGMFPEHSLFQFGFGGQYKGWDTAIEVVELLKPKYPDIMYIGIFNLSEVGRDGQIQYHNQLLDLIKSKNLQANIALHRGYQSELALMNYMRALRVALYPYRAPNTQWASWGASGAVQLPLSLGLPMVMSRFPSFVDFEADGFPLCSTAKEMARVVDRIFSDPSYEKQMVETSLRVATRNSWSNVAQWYLQCSPREDFNAF